MCINTEAKQEEPREKTKRGNKSTDTTEEIVPKIENVNKENQSWKCDLRLQKVFKHKKLACEC